MFLESLSQCSYLTSTLLVIITLYLAWIFLRKISGRPPGPLGIPILGNILSLDPSDLIGSYDKLRQRYGDVFNIRLGNQEIVMICGYDNIRQALVKQGEFFTDRPQLYIFSDIMNPQRKGIVQTSGDLWKEQRAFTLHTLRDFGFGRRPLETKIMEEVGIFLEELEEARGQPYANIRDLAKVSISNIVCSVLFGYSHDSRDPQIKKLLDNIEGNFKLIGLSSLLNFLPILRFIPGDPFKLKQIISNGVYHQRLLRETVEEHKETFDENNIRDFIDAYIREMRKRESMGDTDHFFSDLQLFYTIGDLFATSVESSSEVIIWTILYLIHNPTIQDQIREEVEGVVGSSRYPSMEDLPKLPYLEAVINEVLRISDVSPFSTYSTSSDVTFKGYVIPKGTMVLFNQHSIMKDPNHFENPEMFNPKRFLNEDNQFVTKETFIPFGIGRRNCIGEKLARQTLFLFISSLVQRFRLEPEENQPLPSLDGICHITNVSKPFKFCAIKINWTHVVSAITISTMYDLVIKHVLAVFVITVPFLDLTTLEQVVQTSVR